MKQNESLVRYSVYKESKESLFSEYLKKANLSPFERFMIALEAVFCPNKTHTPDKKGFLVKTPVLEIVASGLITLCVSVARKKLQREILTQLDMLDVSSRVNLFLNAGLAVLYGNDEQMAVSAFAEQVLNFEIPEGKGISLSVVCQKQSAQFFAKLYKEAEESAFKLNNLYRAVINSNRLGGEEGMQIVNNQALLDNTKTCLRLLNINNTAENQHKVKHANFAVRQADNEDKDNDSKKIAERDMRILSSVKSCIDALQAMYRLVETLKEIPINIDAIPVFLFDKVKIGSVDSEWLMTQLHLSVLDAKANEEVLTDSQYEEANIKIKEMTSKEIFDKFLQRMRERGYRPKVMNLGILKQYVMRVLSDKHLWYVDFMGYSQPVYVRINLRKLKLDDDSLVEYCKAEADHELDWMLLGKKEKVYLEKQVIPNVDWNNVKNDDLIKMQNDESNPVESTFGRFTPTQFARIVVSLDDDKREELLEVLEARNAISEPIMAALVKENKVPKNKKILFKCLRFVPKKKKMQYVNGSYEYILKKYGEFDAAPVIDAWVEALSDLSKKELQSFLLANRRTFISNIFQDKMIRNNRTMEGIWQIIAQKLFNVWDYFVLGLEVWIRYDSDYRDFELYDKEKDTKEIMPVPWDRLLDSGFEQRFNMVNFLNVDTLEKAKNHIEKHTEDEVFLWLFEDNPRKEFMLKKYQKMREKFFKRYAHIFAK